VPQARLDLKVKKVTKATQGQPDHKDQQAKVLEHKVQWVQQDQWGLKVLQEKTALTAQYSMLAQLLHKTVQEKAATFT
jgi:hypothetical protein